MVVWWASAVPLYSKIKPIILGPVDSQGLFLLQNMADIWCAGKTGFWQLDFYHLVALDRDDIDAYIECSI
jgi:hypothetical protein